MDPGQPLQLVFGLHPRDAQGLEQRLKDLYDPHSKVFRKFLSPEQVADEFGPSADDYRALTDFLVQHHFQVLHSHRNRLFLSVRARAADVQEALHLGLRRFQRPDGSGFFAPDREPDFALSPLVRHIAGLENFGRVGPRAKAAPEGSRLQPATGSGPACAGGGSYTGKDLRHIYVPCTGLTGAGQTVALVEFDNYYDADITTYAAG
ncbi:MAG TPA: protease pro-enzyme activation domain-containing protein, partial [bacterium]|nr:protease pro-enzyme activation domain-containing protein [bacterium]